MSEWTIHHGDVRKILKTLPDDHFDGVLSDPPYELSNDGKASPSRVAYEFMFPKEAKVETDYLRRSELSLLVGEILQLDAVGIAPGPASAVPVGAVAFHDDPSLRKNNVKHARKRTVLPSKDDARTYEKSETTKHIGSFALKAADPIAILEALNGAGTQYCSGGLWIGARVRTAGLAATMNAVDASLQALRAPVDLGDEVVRATYDPLSREVGAPLRAEEHSVPYVLSLGRCDEDVLATGAALGWLGALQQGGAELVRASSGARRLPSKLQTRRIRVVGAEAHRTLTFDLLVHPIDISSTGFMGKAWDGEKSGFDLAVWDEVRRVMKPGAHALIFGGSRTFHRLMSAVEDVGLVPRDLLMYLHGKGFPKSLDIAKAIDKQAGHWRGRAGKVKSANGAMGGPNLERSAKGEATTEAGLQWSGWGSALKPAYEPVLLAMKMLDGTFAENVQKWGTGALNIDGCRVGDEERHNPSASPVGMWDSVSGKEKDGRPPVGRWPANVVLNDVAAEMVDAASGDRPSTMTGRADPGKKHAHPADASRVRDSMFGNERAGGSVYADAGGASRFFYTTKVSRGEREQGCEAQPARSATAPRSPSPAPAALRNIHPTLKSIDLTRWLATMLLPPPRTDGKPRRILVPFSGAGSEMIGCIQAGWDEVVGIEGEAEYIAIAKSRITKGGVFSGLLDKRMRTPKREREREREQASGRLVYRAFPRDRSVRSRKVRG